MIDLRELQKRGVVQIPRRDIIIPTNSDGFVELTKKKKIVQPAESTEDSQISSGTQSSNSNSDFFNFLDSGSKTGTMETYAPESDTNFSTQTDGYNKREVDEKMVNLDNKIYKLEQRLELVERKLDVGDGNNSNVGAMGW